MKIPTSCPCCHDPLMNTYLETRSGPGNWKKTCANKLNHKFTCLHTDFSEELSMISVEITNKINATWWPLSKTLVVSAVDAVSQDRFSNKGKSNHNFLPYFDPDFSNYKKLIDKLKTYVVFS